MGSVLKIKGNAFNQFLSNHPPSFSKLIKEVVFEIDQQAKPQANIN